MAKILCITTGLTGILNASFQFVKLLKEAGHQVVYAAPRPVSKRVEAQQIAFVQLPEIPEHPHPETPAFSGFFKKIKRLFYKIRYRSKRQRQALEILRPTEFETLLNTEKPDLVISDIELHEYIIKTHAMRVPLVLLSQWFSIWRRPGLPYLLNDRIPGRGWRGTRMMVRWEWQRVKWQRDWIFFKQKLRSGGTNRRTILLNFAREQGFPLHYLKENYWPGPFHYDVLPVLSMTAKEMEFQHDQRPNSYYVGPMVFTDRKDPPASGNPTYTLNDVFEYCKKIKGALIYCSLSTVSKGDYFFIKKLIAAVKFQRDWVLILSIGKLERADLGDLPGNVFPFKFVPQLDVLKYTDCSINHGGIHTINECITFKVPMLIYSGKRSDQSGCAARVHYHGLGIMADKDKDTANDIRKKIKKILNDQSIQKRIEEMHQHFTNYPKDFFAQKIISKLLAE